MKKEFFLILGVATGLFVSGCKNNNKTSDHVSKTEQTSKLPDMKPAQVTPEKKIEKTPVSLKVETYNPSGLFKDTPLLTVPIQDVLAKLEKVTGTVWYGLYLMGKKVGYSTNEWKVVKTPSGKTVVNYQKFHMEITNMAGKKVVDVSSEMHFEGEKTGQLLNHVNVQSTPNETRKFELKREKNGKYIFYTATKDKSGNFIMNKISEIPEPAGLGASELAIAYKISCGSSCWKKNEKWKSIKFNYSTGGLSTEVAFVTGSKEEYSRGIKTKLFELNVMTDKPSMTMKTTVDSSGVMVSGNMGPIELKRMEKTLALKIDSTIDIGIAALVKTKLEGFKSDKHNKIVLNITGNLSSAVFKYNPDRYKYKKIKEGNGILTLTKDSVKGLKKVNIKSIKDNAILEASKPDHNIESDHAEIKKIAAKISASSKDPIVQVEKTVNWVFKSIAKTMSSDFDSAVKVAKELKGDCTEHSLLTTAILRALGFPARMVGGIGYVEFGEGKTGFGYHAWVQVYLGRWVDIDPTWNQFPADAGHILLGSQTDLNWISLIGNIKVDKVLEIK